MGRPFLLQLPPELGYLLRVGSPSIPGEVSFSAGILELGGELLLFHSELEQSVPALGEDCLGPTGVDKVGEECLHRPRAISNRVELEN